MARRRSGNRASAIDNRGAASNIAEATISIKRDQLGDRMTIIGRIADGGCSVDPGKAAGVAGVRVMLQDGSYTVTDEDGRRWLYLSGQIPVAPDGSLAADFTGQCRQVWANVETQLHAAGMTLDNLVKVTTFLATRDHALENRQVRLEVLAGRQPALTVIVTGLFDESWLVEIEGVAAA